jgi:uncharacterized membrane protein
MRHVTFGPPLSLRGRRFKGARGVAGKPFHPPLTDVPLGAFVLAAVFDLISFAGGTAGWTKEFYQAATFCLIAGLAVAVLAALTGTFDWWRSSEPGTQARRTINAHALLMVSAVVIVVVDVALRWLVYHSHSAPPSAVLGLTLAIGAVGAIGETYGGSMVFDYGFNVETSGDHPVWHKTETDVYPGDAHAAPAVETHTQDRPVG